VDIRDFSTEEGREGIWIHPFWSRDIMKCIFFSNYIIFWCAVSIVKYIFRLLLQNIHLVPCDFLCKCTSTLMVLMMMMTRISLPYVLNMKTLLTITLSCHRFLQGVSGSCKPCTSYDRDVCLSVRPSVRPSHADIV